MRGWRTWALVAFVIGLAVAIFYYIHTLPAVTEDELREVLAEVEHIPASLDDIECQRPALLGASTQDALSLEDLLATDGPFAGCWAAVSSDEWHITITDGAHFEGYDGDEVEVGERVSRVLTACSALPAEAELQARTPNRCTPSPLSSDRWRRHVDEYNEERTESLLGRPSLSSRLTRTWPQAPSFACSCEESQRRAISDKDLQVLRPDSGPAQRYS